jgi:signal transduction histidine kinase
VSLPRLALLTFGIAFGVAVEWTSFGADDPTLAVADFAVGSILLVCGVVAWSRRPESRVGALMSLAGLTWFLGTAFEPALYFHRGPLAHLYLSYPNGRLSTPLSRIVVAAAYVDAATAPLARNDAFTLVLSAALALAAIQVLVRTSGPARKAATPALVAALAFAGVLVLGAIGRAEGWSDDVLLWAYEVVIALLTIVLFVDLMRRRWTEAVVTGLVADLGPPQESGTLRARLARALGDPALVVGYRVPATGEFVDEAGRPVRLPPSGSGRQVTSIEEGGHQIAMLVHDEALVADRQLLESVAAAAGIAVANAALQAEARMRADELEQSRRRIVESGDAQRRRLEQELRLGPERRLDHVGTLFARARTKPAVDGSSIELLENELDEARQELRMFAQGIHPAPLSEGGLMPALTLLADRSSIPIEVRGAIERVPESVEAALFFVCAEALTNVAKHARASHASIELREEGGWALATIEDDGVGGASPGHGSGLHGLADRVEALGGRLRVESPPDGGTRVVAEIRVGASESA